MNGNTLAQINGGGAEVEVTPLVTAGAYTAGFQVGPVMTFPNVFPATCNGILESITIKFAASLQTTEFDLAIFSAQPSGTFGDHAAPAIATADSALLIGIYALTSAQSQLGTHTIYNLDAIGKQICSQSTNLYGVLISRAASAALASTADVSVRIGTVW